MAKFEKLLLAIVPVAALVGMAGTTRAADLTYVGTHWTVEPNFPNYDFNGPDGQCCFVPWHSDTSKNVFAASNVSPNRYYGTAGWALFGTVFDFPNANATSDIFYRNVNDELYPNLEQMPDFISATQIMAVNKAAGGAAALLDDPRYQSGIRYWTFDGTNYPPPDGTNTTGSVPYVKTGFLHHWDNFGHNPARQPAGRWGFQIGDNPPERIRIGVITDGLASVSYAPDEVFLIQADPDRPVFSRSELPGDGQHRRHPLQRCRRHRPQGRHSLLRHHRCPAGRRLRHRCAGVRRPHSTPA